MDKRQLGKLILRQRKDLIFWVVLLFNTLTAFATPAVDWYFPLKLVLLLWVGSGEKAETGLAAGGSGPGAGSAVSVPGSLAPEGGISPAGTLVPGDGSLHLVQPVAFLRKAEDAQAPGNPVDPVAGAPDRRGPVGGG